MADYKPRKPDYEVFATEREGPDKRRKARTTKIGKAWKGARGEIHISIGPCIAFDWRDDLKITMWPVGGSDAEEEEDEP